MRLLPYCPTHCGSTHYGSTHYGSTHHGSTYYGSTHFGPTHHGSTHHSPLTPHHSPQVRLLLLVALHAADMADPAKPVAIAIEWGGAP